MQRQSSCSPLPEMHNPSIKGASSGRPRLPPSAPRVKRCAPKMMRHILTSALGVISLIAAPAYAQYAGRYAASPFAVEAIEPVRALVESVGINNFLGKERAGLNDGQRQGAREHLHALVDSRVKQLYAKSGSLSPPQPDPTLAMLYSWAGRLGVYGADLVYPTVRGTYPVQPPPGPRTPAGFDLALLDESLVLSSVAGGWRASIPYHFFIFAIEDATASDGLRTEAIAFSTGTAPDAARPGYSQATVGLVFVHGADKANFEEKWLGRLQIPPTTELAPIGPTKYQSRSTYDPLTRLHKEFVYVPVEKGAFAVFYSGLDGTYQANRAHFLDFMRLLKLPS